MLPDAEVEGRDREALRAHAGALVRAFLSRAVLQAPYGPRFGAVLSGIVEKLHGSLRQARARGRGEGEGGAGGGGEEDAWLDAPIARNRHSGRGIEGFVGGWAAFQ